MPDEPLTPGVFPTTDWSLVGHAGDELDGRRRAALDELLRRYWPALKAHLVIARRIDPHDADDLLQSFIADKVLERNLVGVAEPAKGRFRGLLVAALDHYAANELRRRSSRKRAAERAVSLEAHDQDCRWAAVAPPDQVFDVMWARQLLHEVAARMKTECLAAGRESWWGVFESRVLAPALEGTAPLGYEELVARFGFPSPVQASNALMTAKRMFARLLRATVAEYALDSEDIDTEIRDLERIVSQ